MEEFLLPCINKQLFGMDCLGCGAQRAFVLVLQGDFSAALKMYPAVYTLLGLFSFLILNFFIKFKYNLSIKIGLIILNAIVIIGAYAYKMNQILN